MALPTFPVLGKCFETLQHWSDGTVALGTSNLMGRYWCGSIWCFQSADEAPDTEKCISAFDACDGVCDSVCLPENKLLVGLDSGSIQVYYLEADKELHCLFHSLEHDEAVCSVGITSDNSKAVSGSYDQCIKVWDLETVNGIATYRPAHGGIVWRVSCSTTDPLVFLSCSEDKSIKLWDLRLPRPAIKICNVKIKSVPTAVAWKPNSSTVFAVGDDSGSIAIKDLRHTSNESQQFQPHQRGIFRLVFSPSCPNLLASCADDVSVYVADLGKTKAEIIYEDHSHCHFVRDLSWNPSNNNYLYSCAWDKQVKRHVVTNGMDFNNGTTES